MGRPPNCNCRCETELITLRKYAADGTLLWSVRVGDHVDRIQLTSRGLVVRQAGGVIAGGRTFLVAPSDGSILADPYFSDRDVIFSPSEQRYAERGRWVPYGATLPQAGVRLFDAADNLLYELIGTRNIFTGEYSDDPTAICFGSDDSLYVATQQATRTGGLGGSLQYAAHVRRILPDGTTAWIAEGADHKTVYWQESSENPFAYSTLAEAPDGNLLAAGHARTTFTGSYKLTNVRKFDRSSGAEISDAVFPLFAGTIDQDYDLLSGSNPYVAKTEPTDLASAPATNRVAIAHQIHWHEPQDGVGDLTILKTGVAHYNRGGTGFPTLGRSYGRDTGLKLAFHADGTLALIRFPGSPLVYAWVDQVGGLWRHQWLLDRALIDSGTIRFRLGNQTTSAIPLQPAGDERDWTVDRSTLLAELQQLAGPGHTVTMPTGTVVVTHHWYFDSDLTGWQLETSWSLPSSYYGGGSDGLDYELDDVFRLDNQFHTIWSAQYDRRPHGAGWRWQPLALAVDPTDGSTYVGGYPVPA
ncbi:MAG: hypothetical protein GXP27_14335 [Planctomycetes bacterium]|nr:hypothetical protein [Planctomycetota bacterium]